MEKKEEFLREQRLQWLVHLERRINGERAPPMKIKFCSQKFKSKPKKR